MRTFSIVLADDEPQILQGMRDGIPWESLGFMIAAVAQNGQEALELTQSLQPDLLISDIKMPFIDGLELAQNLHENFVHIKIILFSGWDDFEYARRAISYGVSEYILKPIDFEEMKQLLIRIHDELEQEFDARTDRERQERVYQASLPLLRQQFFIRLVQGRLRQTDIEQQMRLLNLSIDAPVYAAAVFSFPQSMEDYLKQISIRETVEEMLRKVCSFYFFGFYDKASYVLCLSNTEDIMRVLKSLDEAAHMTRRILQTGFFCGVGLCCVSLSQLSQSWNQAKEALEYSVVSQDENIAYYSDILPLEQADSYQWQYSTESLEQAIKHGEAETIREEVDRLLSQLQSCHYNFNEYQIAVLEIVFSLSKLYGRYHITSNADLSGSKNMAMKILSLRTGEELNNWLFNYCDFTGRAIRRRKVDQNCILAQQVRDYVDQHFDQPDLSVETLCEQFHVSASHISKVFRKEVGTSFLNYLTQKRMDEAAKLLRTTDYKSRVIGEMVGYPEPSYFSYVFKKNMNVSPANYRRQGEGK